MRVWLNRSTAMAIIMCIGAVVAVAGKPRVKIADLESKINLEKLVPTAFADWRRDPLQAVQVVNPLQEENLNRIYSQTLARTYVDTTGYRVMVSVAYGDDQRSGIAMSVHYPEVCYPAQGFEVKSIRTGMVATIHGPIPVRRLEAWDGSRRHEPVTYWITLGKYLTLGGLDRRLIELRYGLDREIPDGLLFRVSSVDINSSRAFELQTKFISDLIQSLSPEQRRRLAGKGAD